MVGDPDICCNDRNSVELIPAVHAEVYELKRTNFTLNGADASFFDKVLHIETNVVVLISGCLPLNCPFFAIPLMLI